MTGRGRGRGRGRRQVAESDPQAADNNELSIDLAPIADLSIRELYSHPRTLQVVLHTIGVANRERKRILDDGFRTIGDIVDHYSDDVKGFQSYLLNLNKTFASATVNSVYFTPPILSRIVGVVHYFNICVKGLHHIPDPLEIDREKSISYGQHFKRMFLSEDEKDDDEDIVLPKLTGASDWVAFRDAFISKLASTKGSRGFPVNYVIDSTEREITHGNANLIQVDEIDINDDDLFVTAATHFGLGFKTDNVTVWTKLKNHLLNTPPYNHISDFNNGKDGRRAWYALKATYEGEDFQQRMRDKAFALLTHTFYRGDNNRFTFEKYINVHKQAHKMLLDSGYNEGRGMDDSTKVQHFKSNIRAEAGLESSLSQVRAGGSKYESFNTLTTFLTAEVEHKVLRKVQLKSSNNRHVSSVNKGNKYNHGKNGRRGSSNKNNNIPSEVVDGKRVYGRYYSKRDFRNLTKDQRDTVIKLKREAKNSQNNNGDNNKIISNLRSEIQDDMTQMEERIISGVIRGSKEQSSQCSTDSITTADEHNSNGNDNSKRRRSAPSGSVGSFLSKQRRRQK